MYTYCRFKELFLPIRLLAFVFMKFSLSKFFNAVFSRDNCSLALLREKYSWVFDAAW
jgi:hypothetical protein